MRTLISATLLLALAGLAPAQRVSPHEKTTGKIGAADITIEYGRPYKKGRQIFGGLEPLGKVWRTGADEATTFTTTADLTVGTLKVPAGSYALFTIPDAKQWTLILNKTVKQWGAFSYDPKQDLGRTTMKLEKAATPLEQHTITIEGGAKSGVLKIAWDDAVATVAVTQP
jgi:hypothetical protein